MKCQLGDCDVKMSSVLRNINDYCKKQEDEMKKDKNNMQRYNILLILTNDQVTDEEMDQIDQIGKKAIQDVRHSVQHLTGEHHIDLTEKQ